MRLMPIVREDFTPQQLLDTRVGGSSVSQWDAHLKGRLHQKPTASLPSHTQAESDLSYAIRKKGLDPDDPEIRQTCASNLQKGAYTTLGIRIYCCWNCQIAADASRRQHHVSSVRCHHRRSLPRSRKAFRSLSGCFTVFKEREFRVRHTCDLPLSNLTNNPVRGFLTSLPMISSTKFGRRLRTLSETPLSGPELRKALLYVNTRSRHFDKASLPIRTKKFQLML